MAPIQPNEVYTTAETQELLKVSRSTIKRLLKKGAIRAHKLGGQYRILGKEILSAVSPKLESKAEKIYSRIKRKTVERIKHW